MPPPDVLFALSGDARRNSRALRQLDVFAAMGLKVEVLSFGPAPGTLANARLRPAPRPSGSGPLFFARLHRRMKKAAAGVPARIYHASDLYVLPALYAASKKHGGRLAYDARECYPHVAATAGRPWIRGFWQMLEKHYIRRADAVFTVSKSIADHLAGAYDIAPPVVLYNVPGKRTAHASNKLREWTRVAPHTPLLLHQGNMQQDRGCLLLIEAMQNVNGGALIFLGDGPLRPPLERRVREAGVQDRVFFFDPVPPRELLSVTASADVGITLLEDTCLNHRYALPNKLFEYLAAGLPVLAGDLPEIRRVLSAHCAGILVNPADRGALVRALQRLIDDGGLRRKLAERAGATLETFSHADTSNRLKHSYQELLME